MTCIWPVSTFLFFHPPHLIFEPKLTHYKCIKSYIRILFSTMWGWSQRRFFFRLKGFWQLTERTICLEGKHNFTFPCVCARARVCAWIFQIVFTSSFIFFLFVCTDVTTVLSPSSDGCPVHPYLFRTLLHSGHSLYKYTVRMWDVFSRNISFFEPDRRNPVLVHTMYKKSGWYLPGYWSVCACVNLFYGLVQTWMAVNLCIQLPSLIS